MVIKKMHEVYGPVVRVGPNEVVFSTAQAWEDIYGHRPGRPNMHKSPIHVGAVEPMAGASTLTMADDTTHSRQRRALAHAFSQKALYEQQEIIQQYVNMFIENIGKLCDRQETVNIVNWYNFTTFDIIGDLAFGEPFGCLEQGVFFSSPWWLA